jgi:hypothetical protein
VHNNKHVEQWLSRREDIEREFTWTSKTLRHVVFGALLIPIAMYNGITWAAHKDDDYGERPVRWDPVAAQTPAAQMCVHA